MLIIQDTWGKKSSKSPLPQLKNNFSQVYQQKDWSFRGGKRKKMKGSSEDFKTLSPFMKRFVNTKFDKPKRTLHPDFEETNDAFRSGINHFRGNSMFSSQNSLLNTLHTSQKYNLFLTLQLQFFQTKPPHRKEKGQK